MTGDDVKILASSDFHKANVTGIGDSALTNLPLVTTAGLVETYHGPAIIILHQYAHYGKGHTIHSAGQLHAFGNLYQGVPKDPRVSARTPWWFKRKSSSSKIQDDARKSTRKS